MLDYLRIPVEFYLITFSVLGIILIVTFFMNQDPDSKFQKKVSRLFIIASGSLILLFFADLKIHHTFYSSNIIDTPYSFSFNRSDSNLMSIINRNQLKIGHFGLHNSHYTSATDSLVRLNSKVIEPNIIGDFEIKDEFINSKTNEKLFCITLTEFSFIFDKKEYFYGTINNFEDTKRVVKPIFVDSVLFSWGLIDSSHYEGIYKPAHIAFGSSPSRFKTNGYNFTIYSILLSFFGAIGWLRNKTNLPFTFTFSISIILIILIWGHTVNAIIPVSATGNQVEAIISDSLHFDYPVNLTTEGRNENEIMIKNTKALPRPFEANEIGLVFDYSGITKVREYFRYKNVSDIYKEYSYMDRKTKKGARYYHKYGNEISEDLFYSHIKTWTKQYNYDVTYE